MKRSFSTHLDRVNNAERLTKTEAESQGIKPKTVGRPKKYRKAYKSSESELFERELRKWLKTFKWKYFVTATFDRRIKTPLAIYDHQVMGEYSDHLPEWWEPTTWEPSIATALQMMEATRQTLERKCWKRWKMFFVVELHKDGTPHIHALMGNDRAGNGDVEKLSKIWRWLRGGYIRVDEMKEQKESIDYVLKYVTKESVSWDFLTTQTNWLRYKNVPNNLIDFATFLELRKNKIHVIKTGKRWFI